MASNSSCSSMDLSGQGTSAQLIMQSPISNASDKLGSAPKSLSELPNDPVVRHFDLKNIKSREIMIFMEESKIWQELLKDCIERSGVNAPLQCQQLQDLVQERVQYYNAKFNPNLRPKQTPGIPSEFEPSPAPLE